MLRSAPTLKPTQKTRKKRHRLQILIDILKITSNGAKKSKIVYTANLNFKILKSYLKTLKNNSLISGPDINNAYRTTIKGFKFIDHFEGLERYLL